MNSLFLMRAPPPSICSHCVLRSHSVRVLSSSVVRTRSPLGKPQTATTYPSSPALFSCSVYSWFVRMSLCSLSLVTIISLLCRPRTGFAIVAAAVAAAMETPFLLLPRTKGPLRGALCIQFNFRCKLLYSLLYVGNTGLSLMESHRRP
jgi:hypothetical protein